MRIVAEATRHRHEIESSIRRRDRRRIIGEWALHRQDGIFGMDKGLQRPKKNGEDIRAKYCFYAAAAKRPIVEHAGEGVIMKLLPTLLSALIMIMF